MSVIAWNLNFWTDIPTSVHYILNWCFSAYHEYSEYYEIGGSYSSVLELELCGFHPFVYTYQSYYLNRLYAAYNNSCSCHNQSTMQHVLAFRPSSGLHTSMA